MNKPSISIDESKFLKASKRLLSQINEIVPEDNDLKLTTIQEMLSKSLGYRNYFELKNAFKKDELIDFDNNVQFRMRKSFLEDMSKEKILKIISCLNASNR